MDKPRVERYLTQIKPLVAGHFIQDPDPFKESLLWDPKKQEKAKGLELITTIQGYSLYGHPSLFKPSVAEAIDSIPDIHLSECVAFEIEPGSAVPNQDGKHYYQLRLYRKGPSLV